MKIHEGQFHKMYLVHGLFMRVYELWWMAISFSVFCSVLSNNVRGLYFN